jgi:hypothetical protein
MPVSDLKSKCARDTRMFFTSLRKKKITTTKVPMCRTRLNRGVTDKPKKYSVIFRCAVLEMGSHSDTPWISPRIMVWSSWSSNGFQLCVVDFHRVAVLVNRVFSISVDAMAQNV